MFPFVFRWSVLCASAFLCITQPAKKTAAETWGGYTLENCILFCFSFLSSFFSPPRDVSSQLKGYVSQHHLNVLTPQLWGVEIGKKHCQRKVLRCQWTPEVQHERGDFVYVRVYLLTTSPRCDSSLTSLSEMNNVQTGKHSLFAVHSDSIYFGSRSNVLLCSQISANTFAALSFRLFVRCVRLCSSGKRIHATRKNIRKCKIAAANSFTSS